MNSSTSKLTQKAADQKASSRLNQSVQQYSARVLFLGIVIMALGCWLVPVSRLSSALIGPALSAAAVIFLVAINYVISPKQK